MWSQMFQNHRARQSNNFMPKSCLLHVLHIILHPVWYLIYFSFNKLMAYVMPLDNGHVVEQAGKTVSEEHKMYEISAQCSIDDSLQLY